MRFIIAVTFFIAIGPADASAQRSAAPIVVLAMDRQSEVLAERMRAGFVKAGARAVLASDIERTLPKNIEAAAPATAAALASALQGAIRRYYYAAKPSAAAATIAKAIDEALALLPRLRERATVWDAARRALAMLATIALESKNEANARAACRRFAERDPDWDPPARDFAPGVRRLCAEERAKIKEAPHGALTIVTGSATSIFVDGLPRGAGSRTMQLSVGEHDVQGLEDGVLSAARRVFVVREGARVSLEPYCEARGHSREPRCRAFILDRARAKGVLEIGATRASVRMRLWHGATLARDVQAPLALRMSANWLTQLAAYALGDRQSPPELPKEGGPPFYKRWWFWTALGVVAAGSLGAALLVPRPGAQLEFTIVTPPR
jgi:hypothetical protein